MPTDVCSASCCWLVLFFVVFSLCLKLLLPWLWPLLTPLVTVLQYIIAPHNCYHGPFLDGASSNIRSAWCSSATTADTEALLRCCWPCHCVPAATPVSDASSGLCQLCHGSSTGRFIFQSWAPHHFLCVGVCSGVYLLLSHTMLDAVFTYWSPTIGVYAIAAIWSLSMAGICATCWWSSAHTRNALSGPSLHCFE